MLLGLWRRLADVAPIPPLAWEPPYAEGGPIKSKKKKKKKKEGRTQGENCYSIEKYTVCM